MARSAFGWSYPPGCSGPPEDPVDEPKFRGNSRQRRKARRAMWPRCPRHGKLAKWGDCNPCQGEQEAAWERMEQEAREPWFEDEPDSTMEMLSESLV